MNVPEPATTERPRRWPAALAWGLGLIGVAEILAILAISASAGPGAGVVQLDNPFVVVLLITIGAYSLVGAAIAAQRPGHYAGWTLAAGGVGFGLAVLAFVYAQVGLSVAPHWPGAEFAPWLGELLFIPTLGGTAILFLLHFPNGRLPGTMRQPSVRS